MSKSLVPELIYYCEFDPDNWDDRLEITFSNKHSISLLKDQETITLSINEKSSLIPEGFFGNNISNITVIAGKNGVGKTNIFSNIKGIYKDESYLLIFKVGDNFIVENNSDYQIYDGTGIIIRDKNNQTGDLLAKSQICLCFSMNTYDQLYSDFRSNQSHCILKSHYFLRTDLHVSNSQLYKILTDSEDLFKNNFRAFSNESKYIFMLDGNRLPVLSLNLEKKQTRSAINNIIKLATSSEVKKETCSKFLLLTYLFNTLLCQVFDNSPNDNYENNPLLLKIIQLWENTLILDESLIDKMKNLLRDEDLLVNRHGVTERDSLLSIYEELVRESVWDLSGECGNLNLEICLQKWDRRIHDFLQSIESISHSILEERSVIGIDFGGFSAGESELLKLLVSLRKFLTNENVGIQTAIVFLDEYEKHLHPEWLRIFLNEFLWTVCASKQGYKFAEEINIQIIINTHSPYLISDLPKEHIRLIARDEQSGKREVSIPKYSFASNYYDILSDSFFLEDTIGEFAKQKIQGWIKQLNDLESLSLNDREKLETVDEISKLIKIVDDRFMQGKLLELAKDVRNNILKKADKALQASLIDDEIAKLKEMKKQLNQEGSQND